MKVSELIGPALDWAVAKCAIKPDVRNGRDRFWLHPGNPKLVCVQTYNHDTNPKGYELYYPSTNWSQGGPIIEREEIELGLAKEFDKWYASKRCPIIQFGPTPLIAAMRCYVASKLGDEVDIPNELKG